MTIKIPIITEVTRAIAMLVMLIIPALLHAQYSSDVFDLKQLSELYDERGFMQNKSITVDGKLIVSNSNGNVSYSYPISSTTVSGYPLDVTLNYCGSVAFSSFLEFDAGTPVNPYTHWNKFHQNRPAWVLGVNGFAIGVLSSSANFHCHPSLHSTTKTQFNDADFTWVVDGFDFNNRMARIETASGTNKYVDEIRLLRADGSLLHLVNVNEELPLTPSYSRPDLYTGYYYVNEANSRGYGVVEFDSTYWPGYIRNPIDTLPAFQHIPRRLRYYDGSGLEYVFYEWVIPYGQQPYRGLGITDKDRYGSTVGGPTIFYLEQINSNAGEISRFHRSRHYYPNERTSLIDNNIYMPQLDSTLDSTRGRALITEFRGHRISYGDIGLVIESFGRTVKAQFGTITHSGIGASGNSMPLASRGYLTTMAADLANSEETTDALYRSHTGYITQLTDAEGRKTTFEYEPYTMSYINYGFPKTSPAPGVDIVLTLNNHRLKKVVEPTASYTISYRRGNFNIGGLLEDVIRKDTIRADVPSGHDPFRLNNVASYIRKYDPSNTLLTTQQCEFTYSGGFTSGTITTTDNISGLSRSIYNSYSVHPLPESHNPAVPQPRFTSLDNTVETGAITVSTSTSYADSTSAGYLWLPYEQAVTVDGLLKSKQRFAYLLDTVRTFGGDTALQRRFGWEAMRRTVETFDPGTGKVRLRDTIEYLHIPPIDTTLVRLDSAFKKLITLQRYRDSLAQPGSRFRNIPWEYASYDPAIAEFLIDSSEFRQTLPPIYGLERRSWQSDSTGRFLGGVSRAYSEPSGAPHYFHDMAFRGVLLADTVIGLDRSERFVAARYEHTRGWGLNLLNRKFNALGASERYFYTSYGSLKLRGSDGVYRPLGKVVSNDNEVRDTILPHNGYFSLAFEKPLINESYVRRYDPTGTLLIDTLVQLNEYTHYGQVKGSVDINGYYSRYA